MSEQKWTRSSVRSLSARLGAANQRVCPNTVRRLLRAARYSLRANVKRDAGAQHPERNRQFEYLAAQKQAFLADGQPVLSVDTKKKELVGNFKNGGQRWCQEAEAVNIHDFPQDALGRAVPYGLYDVARNEGYVYVGESADTPEFAVTAIATWWHTHGQTLYPQATRLLIVCDAGGSNGCRPRAWKQQVQTQLSDRFGLEVTICHYPTGCSKWNPIEYRLFSPISLNWAGTPLRTWDIVLACIRGTTTRTGLTVQATLLAGVFATGVSVSHAQMKTLNMHGHATCPRWNYTFKPRNAQQTTTPNTEVVSEQ